MTVSPSIVRGLLTKKCLILVTGKTPMDGSHSKCRNTTSATHSPTLPSSGHCHHGHVPSPCSPKPTPISLSPHHHKEVIFSTPITSSSQLLASMEGLYETLTPMSPILVQGFHNISSNDSADSKSRSNKDEDGEGSNEDEDQMDRLESNETDTDLSTQGEEESLDEEEEESLDKDIGKVVKVNQCNCGKQVSTKQPRANGKQGKGTKAQAVKDKGVKDMGVKGKDIGGKGAKGEGTNAQGTKGKGLIILAIDIVI